jgi:transposase
MKRISRGRTDYATEQARRLAAGRRFARGQSQAEVARQLQVSRQSASRWFHAWQAHGTQGLRGAERTGRLSKLTPAEWRQLEALLLQGPRAQGYATDLWTLKRIARTVWKHFRVRYHPGHVWKLLGRLGWSCQRPTSKARERNEAGIRRWLKRCWPQIKKRRAGRGPA